MRKEKVSHHRNHRTMNKEMVNQLPLPHTHDTSISQVPTSALQVIRGKDFIQIRVSYKEKDFRRDSGVSSASVGKEKIISMH